MPYATHECRWFFEGALDRLCDGLVARFRTAGDWRRNSDLRAPEWTGSWREDRYETLARNGEPRDAGIGIKLRDERGAGGPLRLEFKARSATLGAVQFTPESVGNVERWLKWSCDAADVPESLLRPFVDGTAGVLIRKKRLLRKIRFDSDCDEEVPLDLAVDRGLEIELTKIVVGRGEENWTLGFEAFPQDEEVHADFNRCVSGFLSDFGSELDLSESRSMSYPEWLVRADYSA